MFKRPMISILHDDLSIGILHHAKEADALRHDSRAE